METIQTQFNWDTAARAKFTMMIGKIPLFHREIALQVVEKKAAQNAIARGAFSVEEEDIVAAFFSEVPKAFYSLMVRLLDEVGFDYKNYQKK